MKEFKQINHGLLQDQRRPKERITDYVFGASPVLADILRPDGQWADYLPNKEYQRQYNFDTMGCVSFSALNCIETLLKAKYNLQINFSDRALAKASGTTIYGNSLWQVADTIRNWGLIKEEDWSWLPDIDTWEEYYAFIPSDIQEKRLWFISNFNVNYEFLLVNNEDMVKEALKYAPLQVTVGFNSVDNNGYYYREGNPIYNHAITLFGYLDKTYWLVFDQYDQVVKKVRWDYKFGTLLKYNIIKNTTMDIEFVKLKTSPAIYIRIDKTLSPIGSGDTYKELTGRNDFVFREIEPIEFAAYSVVSKIWTSASLNKFISNL